MLNSTQHVKEQQANTMLIICAHWEQTLSELWIYTERLADLFVNLFEKFEFFLQSLAPVLGVDMKQRLVVQVLHNALHIYHHVIRIFWRKL